MTQAYEVGPSSNEAAKKAQAQGDERTIGEVVTHHRRWLVDRELAALEQHSLAPRLAATYESDSFDEDDDLERDVTATGSIPVKRRQGAAKRQAAKPAATRASSTSRNGSPKRATSQAEDKADGLVAQAGDAARTATQKVGEGATQAADFVRTSVGQGTDFVVKSVGRATDATKTFAGNNPLALAMATLALGVGIGMVLPASAREVKLLAPVRAKIDRFAGDAREAASDVAQIARETANDSLETLT